MERCRCIRKPHLWFRRRICPSCERDFQFPSFGQRYAAARIRTRNRRQCRVDAKDPAEGLVPFNSADQKNAAETDWGRNILELGPPLGFCFIFFRVAFMIWLAARALAAARASGDPTPWLLAVYVGALLPYGQVTANGTLNGYA